MQYIRAKVFFNCQDAERDHARPFPLLRGYASIHWVMSEGKSSAANRAPASRGAGLAGNLARGARSLSRPSDGMAQGLL